MDRRIKYRHIEAFVEIAREGSLKYAARKLFLTQPAISKTLKELEDILGTTLMHRNRGGVTLTKQGAVFLHFAQMSLASLQQGLNGLETADHALKERLNVGALPSVAATLMPEVVTEFSHLAPNGMLRVLDGPHDYLVDRLRLGALDLVIGRLGDPDTMQGLTFTQLYTEQVVFVVRAGHPLLASPDVQRIVDYPVISPPPAAAIAPTVERFLIAHGVGEFPNKIETVSGALGRAYTRHSDAVWIISGGVVANELADGLLVQLPFDTAMTRGPVGLTSRADGPDMRVQHVFRLAVQTVLDRNDLAIRAEGN